MVSTRNHIVRVLFIVLILIALVIGLNISTNDLVSKTEMSALTIETEKVAVESTMLVENFDTKAAELQENIAYLEEYIKAKEEKREMDREKLEAHVIATNVKALTSRGNVTRGFSTFNLTTPTNLSGETLNVVLEDTGLKGLGEAYIKAEKDYGVNALFLISISALESSWGTSKLAKSKNNLFGYQAYTNNPDAAMSFATKEECIDVVAKSLKNNYLTEGGKYHSGFTAKAVNKRYAADVSWHLKVTGIMSRLSKELGIEFDN